MIVTVDGPAASGKSTVARLIALRCDFFYICSGFIYRYFGYSLLQNQIDFHNEHQAVLFVQLLQLVYKNDDQKYPFIGNCDGLKDCFCTQEALHDEKVGYVASIISQYEQIRSIALLFQRSFAEKYQNIIIDGRDCGTIVFPKATVKFFITANAQERAKRLMKRNAEMGIESNYEEILKGMIARDQRDTNRKHAPLIPADDSIIIDTSALTLEQVIEKCLLCVCSY